MTINVPYGGQLEVHLQLAPYTLGYTGLSTGQGAFNHQSGIPAITFGQFDDYALGSYHVTRCLLESFDRQRYPTTSFSLSEEGMYGIVVNSNSIQFFNANDTIPISRGEYSFYGYPFPPGVRLLTANQYARFRASASIAGNATVFTSSPVINGYGSTYNSLMRFYYNGSSTWNIVKSVGGVLSLTGNPNFVRFQRLVDRDNCAGQIARSFPLQPIPDMINILAMNNSGSDPSPQIYTLLQDVFGEEALAVTGGPSGSAAAFDGSDGNRTNRKVWRCGTNGFVVRTQVPIHAGMGRRFWFFDRQLEYWYDVKLIGRDSATTTLIASTSPSLLHDDNGIWWFKSTTNTTLDGTAQYNYVSASAFVDKLYLPRFVPGASLPHYYKYDDPVMRGSIYA